MPFSNLPAGQAMTTDCARAEVRATIPSVRPATAIVVLVLLAVIIIAAIVQAVELLSPPGSVPSQLPG